MKRNWCAAASRALLVTWIAALVAGCETPGPIADKEPLPVPESYTYVIGPGDSLNIFVWRNAELSRTVAVRPDGKISVPLVEDLVASGKTPTELAREIEQVLATYIREPLVTVIVGGFQGVYETQVRVLGEAAQPTAIPYRDKMTVLDVMVAVGGLTQFADGNKARLVRHVEGELRTSLVRLEDLVRDGDISANVPVAPGDVLIIPEAWF
ncbi:MAG: polysaccharide biosynthesis/export family protein [Ectothiorhodospiraceae bacterium]|nr:polysaccharide biosynthesis/export family protein [Chromatiales bacterium]MCP5157212.1 polysaccharide biosynthesis/export family protein [Ectothiorhodospiraceae bacterium]